MSSGTSLSKVDQASLSSCHVYQYCYACLLSWTFTSQQRSGQPRMYLMMPWWHVLQGEGEGWMRSSSRLRSGILADQQLSEEVTESAGGQQLGFIAT